MTNRHVIHEIVVLIARAAERERAMADQLKRGIHLLRSPLLLDENYLETWIVQAQALIEASRIAHQSAPGKPLHAIQDAPGSTIPIAGKKTLPRSIGEQLLKTKEKKT